MSALPTSCRFRFFECDVFFFGTARRMESHNSVKIGMSVVIAGSVKGRKIRREGTERGSLHATAIG